MTMLGAVPRCVAIAALLVALQIAMPAAADDARQRSGFYLGGHVGIMFGNANATLGDPIGIASAGGITPYGSLFGGVQASISSPRG